MDLKRLRQILDHAASKRILVIGDLMLDKIIRGVSDRLSPEAPVPIVQVDSEDYFPGGAANVARNIQQLGGGVAVAGMVGGSIDNNGQRLREKLTEARIDWSLSLEREKYRTTLKTRIIANHQQLLRLDRDALTTPSDSEVKDFVARISEHLNDFDAVVFEDYAKGFLTQPMVDQIISATKEAEKIVAVDPNPLHAINWHDVTLVKPNRKEAFQAAGLVPPRISYYPDQDPNLLAAGRALMEKWRTQYVLISLAEQGMMLFRRDETPHHIPTKARDVFDVSGAGDTALGLFTLTLAAGANPIEAAEIANHGCAVVIGKIGTGTVTRDELISSFEHDFD
jgi:rfaE bifunctional protein kinase chain/domain